ncbi:hypothetical protein C7410_101303 [Paraburkholderia silvatlantica]|uniref:Uncharacterized protein n=1 Tax=Paraburkholderia silvatlantica TaxID=321895 RepID=A0A2V4TVZ9_9BURK|nr:hypothetical protein [Paraburkholderia silvatlantica]PYE27971.1 hypothetical protein C7410_101303 [Paraburkholderia silvatlantica]
MFKRKLSLVPLAVGSMASLIALDAHAATATVSAIGAGLQHGDMLAGLGTAGAAMRSPCRTYTMPPPKPQ